MRKEGGNTERLKTWALCLVFIALASFIYYYLLPSGKVSQTAKTVISLVTVLAVCVPLFGFFEKGSTVFSDFSFSAETEIFEPYSYYAHITETTVNDKVSLLVRQHTDIPFFIETQINISSDNCIDIEQVTVVFEKYPEKLPELSQNIEKELGISPKFRLKEKNDD